MSELAYIRWMDIESADADGFYFICRCGLESRRFPAMYESQEAFYAHVRQCHGRYFKVPGAQAADE